MQASQEDIVPNRFKEENSDTNIGIAASTKVEHNSDTNIGISASTEVEGNKLPDDDCENPESPSATQILAQPQPTREHESAGLVTDTKEQPLVSDYNNETHLRGAAHGQNSGVDREQTDGAQKQEEKEDGEEQKECAGAPVQEDIAMLLSVSEYADCGDTTEDEEEGYISDCGDITEIEDTCLDFDDLSTCPQTQTLVSVLFKHNVGQLATVGEENDFLQGIRAALSRQLFVVASRIHFHGDIEELEDEKDTEEKVEESCERIVPTVKISFFFIEIDVDSTAPSSSELVEKVRMLHETGKLFLQEKGKESSMGILPDSVIAVEVWTDLITGIEKEGDLPSQQMDCNPSTSQHGIKQAALPPGVKTARSLSIVQPATEINNDLAEAPTLAEAPVGCLSTLHIVTMPDATENDKKTSPNDKKTSPSRRGGNATEEKTSVLQELTKSLRLTEIEEIMRTRGPKAQCVSTAGIFNRWGVIMWVYDDGGG
jgi:hypothetical protein